MGSEVFIKMDEMVGIVVFLDVVKKVIGERLSAGLDVLGAGTLEDPSIDSLTVCLALTAAKDTIACLVHWVWPS